MDIEASIYYSSKGFCSIVFDKFIIPQSAYYMTEFESFRFFKPTKQELYPIITMVTNNIEKKNINLIIDFPSSNISRSRLNFINHNTLGRALFGFDYEDRVSITGLEEYIMFYIKTTNALSDYYVNFGVYTDLSSVISVYDVYYLQSWMKVLGIKETEEFRSLWKKSEKIAIENITII